VEEDEFKQFKKMSKYKKDEVQQIIDKVNQVDPDTSTFLNIN
jgi:hypothetical protein